jgi:hypothetical protein
MNFDMPSFSVTLHAGRAIKAGEEMFTSYCNPFASTAERQEYLSRYGFKCTCAACTTADPEADRLRVELPEHQKEVEDDLELWLNDISLPDDYVINRILSLMEMLEKANLQATIRYQDLMQAAFVSYAALGDVESTVKYGKGLYPELQRLLTEKGYVGTDYLEEFAPSWGARIKLSQRRC